MKVNIANIRQVLRNKFGSRNYRIKANGDIHVHGTMPNTNTVGWYLLGNIDSPYMLAWLGGLLYGASERDPIGAWVGDDDGSEGMRPQRMEE